MYNHTPSPANRLIVLFIGMLSLVPIRLAAQDSEKPVIRLEAAYTQSKQKESDADNARLYYHGGRIGASIEWLIPHTEVLVLRSGLFYSMQYGSNTQTYPNINPAVGRIEYIAYTHYKHDIEVPLHVEINVRIWKDLHLFAFSGPYLNIGLAHPTQADVYLTDDTKQVMRETYGYELESGTRDLYSVKDYDALRRFNLQLGVGGGIQFKRWRLQGGYDWGMIDIGRRANKMKTNTWYAGLSYAF